jgi:GNAT superfamily N-acetyltransferase
MPQYLPYAPRHPQEAPAMTIRPTAAAPPNLPDLDPSAVPVGRFHAWWRSDPLPALPAIPGLRTEPIADAWRAADLIPLPATEIGERMRQGHQLWLARVFSEPVAWGWNATRRFAIGELSIARALPPRTRYLWDFFTLPEWRGRGIYPRLLQAIVASEPDVEQFWVGHDLGNDASARGIAKAGFAEVGLLYRGETSGFALVPSGPRERAAEAATIFAVPIAGRPDVGDAAE